jgi:REP element-mobilizing transposase RayT
MGDILAYFITFSTFGTHLPGDPRGYADRRLNLFGTPFPEPSVSRLTFSRRICSDSSVKLNESERTIVCETICRVSELRGWLVWALHVRSNHIHGVVAARVPPSTILRDWKAYASRELNQLDGRITKRWARHGSTRYLWKPEHLAAAMRYVLEEQGEPMATHVRSVEGEFMR